MKVASRRKAAARNAVFTSRRWTLQQSTLTISDDDNNQLAQLTFAGERFEGKSSSGTPLAPGDKCPPAQNKKATPMSDYQLYCFAQSGNAYRAALMLNLIGAKWEPIWIDFFGKGVQRTPDYREGVNEMGEVPVLVDGDRRADAVRA